ncbi:hypothetical protein LZ554_004220 [Drepanopeziza brunnea f. sp. 'monogermtubi']|nr:hypothetical protein LZ554_004220 [Drepanopeziza brunnea f. sp. 'monogermtubi']
MTSKALPSLPNELWIQVLKNLAADPGDDDLPTLWYSCRQVNTAFKEAAESIVRERQLPEVLLYFELGDDDDVQDHFRFEFSRLSKDGVTATFTLDCYDQDHLAKYMKSRFVNLRAYLMKENIEGPPHLVVIDRAVNDGPIPGLSVNYKDFELSCNWQKLFDSFYAEEFLYHAIMARTQEKRKPLLADLQVKAARREICPRYMTTKEIRTFVKDSQTARKMARRARIQGQFKEYYGTEWDFDRDGDPAVEKECLRTIENMRHPAYIEDTSDDGI